MVVEKFTLALKDSTGMQLKNVAKGGHELYVEFEIKQPWHVAGQPIQSCLVSGPRQWRSEREYTRSCLRVCIGHQGPFDNGDADSFWTHRFQT